MPRAKRLIKVARSEWMGHFVADSSIIRHTHSIYILTTRKHPDAKEYAICKYFSFTGNTDDNNHA